MQTAKQLVLELGFDPFRNDSAFQVAGHGDNGPDDLRIVSG
jgi:hypothetical protein